MEIIKAQDIGFCFGVRRAIKKAEQAIKNLPAHEIYMLGEIIHNPQVIKKFKKKGINIIEEISQVPPDKYLITRAHGISRNEENYIKRNNIKLIDTTCPYVKKLHQIASVLKKEKYQIVILGDIDHPEIKSLLSYI
ncbi:MAG: 4-hydroxy-3-methylbut-2-enyl diphosphate reductase, partial [Atribacterota bacterium]